MTNSKHENRYWGERAVPESKAEFFNAVTTPSPTGDGTVATIRFYGPIDSWGGYWGISTKDVGMVLDALPDTVTQIVLRINSPGGEVFEGVSILNMLRAHKASVTAVVDGLAASAASFVATGCDETVMSPGTQMMIHAPLTFTYGNAAELRKTADVLDGIEASIVEIYTAKAGKKDWATLLADDTWLTAAEAVTLGLADRVAVIPDAGETETVGENDELIILVPAEPDAEDMVARARMTRRPNRLAAESHTLPATEPGEPNRKEDVDMTYDNLVAGLRERLGLTDATATDELLLAAVDTALAAQSTNTAITPPAGTALIDSEVLLDLQAAAADGRQARAEQDRTRRESIVATAVKEGRIAPSSRDTWLAQLTTNEDGTASLLASLAPNTIAVAEIGHSDELSTDDSLYASAWPTPKES
ncbi:peptidase [Cryobacterium sp. MDB1-18-2]|uniref:head maturation protease, ClpP-related n=1 Tax=unclassified Cryobacterium TaxID=2649013 RepID=UPI001068FF3D|nr:MULTISPECIES: head maturation protease, ClpP-related [unclassified Cryobacterium]TFC30104.1 peptidase [Cryobacterium sp. MDB1-18-2]TFC41384.1 peptidase [Cryobacterium sp. MDB1-18-1]